MLAHDEQLWGASEEACHDVDGFGLAAGGTHAEKGCLLDLSDGAALAALGQRFRSLDERIRQAGGEVYPFCLVADGPVSQDLFSPSHPHHLYRNMLKDVLEVLLFHFAPVVTALEAGAHLGVDAATWYPRWQADWGHRAVAAKDLGFEFERDNYRAFRSVDLYPLLVDVTSRSVSACNWTRQITRARAVQLVDLAHEKPEGGLRRLGSCPPHQVHYLADWIVHLATSPGDREQISMIPELKMWFDRGWLQLRDTHFKNALRAIRLWKLGRKPEALKASAKAVGAVSNDWPWSLRAGFAEGFGSWLQKVTSEELRHLVRSNR